jgi:hypothetical protein
MTVRNTHKAYDAMHDRWAACRAASEGEHAVHEATTTYLPKLQAEEDESYALRLQMTPFFNATWRTIAGLRGMLFRKPPTQALPAVLNDLAEDIDLAGTTLLGLAQEVSEEALTVGRVGLLVDYPAAAPGLTLADARALKLRALISVYKAESIYNWETARVNGATVLTQLRLTETATLPGKDEFTTTTETQWRVLDLSDGKYRQRLYHLDKDGNVEQVGKDVFPLMNNAPMSFIPFVVIGVDSVGLDVEAPPLIDLVTTNLHHYLQATSYERGCFFSGLPTLFISGIEDDDKEISIGGNLANALGSPNAKAYYVEVASKFEALRQNLEDKKREMAVLGARMLETPTASAEATATVARRQVGEESILSSMAQSISQGMTRALGWLAAWQGATDTTLEYELNRDFMPTGLSPGELSALVQAWQNGAISQQVLFENLKAGEVVPDELTFEEEAGRIETAALQFAAQQQAMLDLQQPPPPQGAQQ